jgi:hypothetical protein
MFIEGAMAHMAGFGRKAHNVFLSIASGRTKLPGIGHRIAPSSSGNTGKREAKEKDTQKDIQKDTCITEEKELQLESHIPFYVTSDLLLADTDAGALKLNPSDEEFCRVVADQALGMLSTLLPAEHTSGFLLQVVSGRFSRV